MFLSASSSYPCLCFIAVPTKETATSSASHLGQDHNDIVDAKPVLEHIYDKIVFEMTSAASGADEDEEGDGDEEECFAPKRRRLHDKIRGWAITQGFIMAKHEKGDEAKSLLQLIQEKRMEMGFDLSISNEVSESSQHRPSPTHHNATKTSSSSSRRFAKFRDWIQRLGKGTMARLNRCHHHGFMIRRRRRNVPLPPQPPQSSS